ncbi:MAG: hypothetical protein HOP30_12100 [Cyclobacteriaceae bacterium]|nr:hypothetical protein [Cyclobacteriaceae bacterium]
MATTSMAQVGDIKNSSSSNSKSGGGGGDSKGGSSGGGFFVDIFINSLSEIGVWQKYKLDKRSENEYIVSLDVIAQAAVQPSRYYLMNPRIRGNWGLFSTDFRINYLLEEKITGNEDLTTIDWQILQLNLVTTRHVIGRIGGGFMKENFGGQESFFESTYGVFFQSGQKHLGANLEYRLAQDFTTGAIPRRELGAHFEYRLASKGYWNTYLTMGGVYQQYYESVSVWGIQAGLALRVFSPPIQR